MFGWKVFQLFHCFFSLGPLYNCPQCAIVGLGQKQLSKSSCTCKCISLCREKTQASLDKKLFGSPLSLMSEPSNYSKILKLSSSLPSAKAPCIIITFKVSSSAIIFFIFPFTGAAGYLQGILSDLFHICSSFIWEA